jgi:serine/threonine protein kinase
LLVHLPRGSVATNLGGRGTPRYAAPESVPAPAAPPRAAGGRGRPRPVASATSTSSASDVYSFGLSIAEVFCRRKKFKELVRFSCELHASIAGAPSWVAACAGAQKLILEGRWLHPAAVPVPHTAALRLARLLLSCLAVSPTWRPHAEVVALELGVIATLM